MKTNYVIFVGSLLVAASAYVGSNDDITTFNTLFGNVQHFFGLLGVVGSVVATFFAKSPMGGSDSVAVGAKVTGNQKTKLPPDVN